MRLVPEAHRKKTKYGLSILLPSRLWRPMWRGRGAGVGHQSPNSQVGAGLAAVDRAPWVGSPRFPTATYATRHRSQAGLVYLTQVSWKCRHS
jgi:hypothetical protein